MVRPKIRTEHFQPQPNSLLVIFGELTSFLLIFDVMHVLYILVLLLSQCMEKKLTEKKNKKTNTIRNRKMLNSKDKVTGNVTD